MFDGGLGIPYLALGVWHNNFLDYIVLMVPERREEEGGRVLMVMFTWFDLKKGWSRRMEGGGRFFRMKMVMLSLIWNYTGVFILFLNFSPFNCFYAVWYSFPGVTPLLIRLPNNVCFILQYFLKNVIVVFIWRKGWRGTKIRWTASISYLNFFCTYLDLKICWMLGWNIQIIF